MSRKATRRRKFHTLKEIAEAKKQRKSGQSTLLPANHRENQVLDQDIRRPHFKVPPEIPPTRTQN